MSVDITDFTVVNALGGLDNPNAPASISASGTLVQTSEQLTVDARTLADAHASGVTAINVTLGYTLGDLPPYQHTLDEIRTWDAIISAHPRDLMRIDTAADIDVAKRQGRIGIIYGFQNAAAVEDRPERVGTFADLGVRIIQLTYNQANQVGDGSMATGNRGLTPLGRDVVAALNERRVMVDLSHSGEETCLEAARVSAQPVSINHTGCRALVDLPRNKTDEELRLVASQGGFVGIYFMPFLHASGHAKAADVVEHIVHAVNVCGEDHVGIGTDGTITAIDDLDAYRDRLAEQVARRQAAGASAAGERSDTYPFVVDLRGVDQFRELARLLAERGFSPSRIEKILGLNFHNYAKAVWGE
ncbi:peptidase M19 [Actinomadura darangshiensis]|uniref:Peptidase M19 n=1 Tax=Actinomadura darangshiensis TaxID=705336 RepID=A0A4R5AU17_9ACTN|nr:membrane dipeptidase [Actinomadura darangshiensis]TDD76233.1 peptidase M19 [Actinomadura darangshiensis]